MQFAADVCNAVDKVVEDLTSCPPDFSENMVEKICIPISQPSNDSIFFT